MNTHIYCDIHCNSSTRFSARPLNSSAVVKIGDDHQTATIFLASHDDAMRLVEAAQEAASILLAEQEQVPA